MLPAMSRAVLSPTLVTILLQSASANSAKPDQEKVNTRRKPTVKGKGDTGHVPQGPARLCWQSVEKERALQETSCRPKQAVLPSLSSAASAAADGWSWTPAEWGEHLLKRTGFLPWFFPLLAALFGPLGWFRNITSFSTQLFPLVLQEILLSSLVNVVCRISARDVLCWGGFSTGNHTFICLLSQ